MDLLITGASGFLGRNLILQAPDDWRILAVYAKDSGFPQFVADVGKSNVTAVRCDLGDPLQVAELFRKHGDAWECCLYLAAKVDIPWSVKEPQQDLLCNAGPLLNVMECLRAQKFIYFSSGAVYDGLSGEVRPQDEIAPTLPYAISKMTCERYVQFYQRRRRSIENFLVVRFFGAYGPYEAPHKIYTRLIQKFAVAGEDTYTLYGDGKNLIDAMYVGDAVDAIQRMLTGSHWNGTVNLAGGRPLAIEALVREVAQALGLAKVKIVKEGVAHESNQFWGSVREMKDIYGFQPQISLPEGILRFKEFLMAGRSRS